MPEKNISHYLTGFWTLIPFKVGPLSLHTLNPPTLPLLENTSGSLLLEWCSSPPSRSALPLLYSQKKDMAPCDFWLFPKLKMPLKGSRFESREEIMWNATAEMNTIPKEDFQRYFQQWKVRWAKCVQAQGAYFEKD